MVSFSLGAGQSAGTDCPAKFKIQVNMAPKTTPILPSVKPIHYLALGDSYTIGESVPEAERWPNQLAALLGDVEVSIVARTGWTTDELWRGIQAASLRPPYQLVSLLIGVNNQYRGWSLQTYQAEFRALLEKAVEFGGGEPRRVIVLSIPDWGVTPFAESRDRAKIYAEIDAFNAVNRAETQSQGAAYIDITPGSRAAAINPALLASDGLHPSGQMYAQWARAAQDYLVRGVSVG